MKTREEVNKYINNICRTNDNVNFIRLITDINEKKKSFIIDYIVPSIYYNALGEECNIKEDYYYGLSPKLSEFEIGKLIKGDILINEKEFEKYLKENARYFMLDKKDVAIKYGMALFANCIQRVASYFGFVLNNDEEINLSKLDKKYLINNKVCLVGRLTSEEISKLDKYYSFKEDNGELVIIYKEKDSPSFKELYKKDSKYTIVLAKNEEYYSGVLPRLMKIVKLDSSDFNRLLDSYSLVVQRTTYATVDSIDNSTSSFLSDEYRKLIIDFNENEIKAERNLVDEKLQNTDITIGNVNKYLQESNNTRIMPVSTNIETADGYLIYGLRSNSSIDRGRLYCSCNGQSEFQDENVSFYKYSCYEDYPTLSITSKERLDFKTEFERECFAELGITGFSRNYEYLGISILGLITDDPLKKGRLHFNILANHKSEYKFSEIHSGYIHATENFENSEIYGTKVYIPPKAIVTIGHVLGKIKSFLSIFEKLVSLGIFVFTASIIQIVKKEWYEILLKIISIAGSAILGLILTIQFINYLHNLIKTKKILFNRKIKKSNPTIEDFYNENLKCIKKIKNISVDNPLTPIAVLLTTMYYMKR